MSAIGMNYQFGAMIISLAVSRTGFLPQARKWLLAKMV
jgi:hypothetical protein